MSQRFPEAQRSPTCRAPSDTTRAAVPAAGGEAHSTHCCACSAPAHEPDTLPRRLVCLFLHQLRHASLALSHFTRRVLSYLYPEAAKPPGRSFSLLSDSHPHRDPRYEGHKPCPSSQPPATPGTPTTDPGGARGRPSAPPRGSPRGHPGRRRHLRPRGCPGRPGPAAGRDGRPHPRLPPSVLPRTARPGPAAHPPPPSAALTRRRAGSRGWHPAAGWASPRGAPLPCRRPASLPPVPPSCPPSGGRRAAGPEAASPRGSRRRCAARRPAPFPGEPAAASALLPPHDASCRPGSPAATAPTRGRPAPGPRGGGRRAWSPAAPEPEA